MKLCLIGNPENRRILDFQATAVRLGWERPRCLSWLDFTSTDGAESASDHLRHCDLIRIESPGENPEVQRRLIALGGGPNGLLEFGELRSLRESYRGFVRKLDELSRWSATFQNPPNDISRMFDKWECHLQFSAAGLARPKTWLAPATVSEFRTFRDEVADELRGHAFIKPRYGSSASGVCAYRWSSDREQLIAPIEIDRSQGRTRLFNSLRIRSHTSLVDIESILEVLLPQGMICECWIPKARTPEGGFDLRLVVVAGRVRHCVVRQSAHPMTNLHLGNQRGSLDEVESIMGPNVLSNAFHLAGEAAACFPDSLYAGVDILISSSGQVYLCEINAFGDLLPNVQHDGETTYESILRASAQRWATV